MISNMLRFPFSMLDNELNDLFYPDRRRVSANNTLVYPPINISTTDDSVDVYLFLAGMKPDDIDLVIEKNMLSVSGERKLPGSSDDNDMTAYRQERFEGKFKRVITLPETVDTDTTQATYKNGVLHISINKRAEVQPRQIKISAQ